MNQTTIDVHLSSGLKTIAQTSMEVADTLIMLAKHIQIFKNGVYRSK